MKILVIEDEPDYISLLRSRLSSLGHEVIDAADGLEGIKLAKSNQPDLILLDIMMPGLNGFAICRELKADPLMENVPVLILTALGMDDLSLRCREVGADDWLIKTATAKQLIDKVAALTK